MRRRFGDAQFVRHHRQRLVRKKLFKHFHFPGRQICHLRMLFQKHLKCPVLSPSQIDSNYKLGKCRSILRSILINDSVLLIVSALFSILGIWGYGPWGWEASAGFLGMSALCLLFLIIIPTVKQIVKYFQIKNRDS